MPIASVKKTSEDDFVEFGCAEGDYITLRATGGGALMVHLSDLQLAELARQVAGHLKGDEG